MPLRLREGQLEAVEGLGCRPHLLPLAPRSPSTELPGSEKRRDLIPSRTAPGAELLQVGTMSCGQGLAQAWLGLGLHERVRKETTVPSSDQ